MINFIVGLVIGGFGGVLGMALLFVAGEDENDV